MIDFAEVEEQELKVGDLVEPEGDEEPLPDVPGFWPAGHAGGCGRGGRLRLLCFHAAQSNAVLMERQMAVLFSPHSGSETTWLSTIAEWECVDGPLELPEFVDVPASAGLNNEEQPKQRRVLEEGLGMPRAWFQKQPMGSPVEQWGDLQAAIDAAIGQLKARAPLDGLCGFGQGGELVCQLARLAEEGHPELQGRFRFVVTKAARWPKPNNGNDLRPRRPLSVPALHLAELSHSIYAPADFEDLALHWCPERREVIWLERDKVAPGNHQPGLPSPKPKPARITGDSLTRVRRFFTAFHGDQEAEWRPKAPATGDPLAGLALPMARCREAVLAPPSPSRPLQLLCFHDTDGVPGGGELNHRIWDSLRRCAMQTPLANCLEIEAPKLTSFIDAKKEIGAELPASKALAKHHVVSKRAVELAGHIAGKVLASSSLGARPVVLAGIGLGAYFALQCGAALRSRGGRPWRLYAVKPPAAFPAPAAGALGGCGVLCLLDPWDTSGERWRLSAATRGSFRTQVLEHTVGRTEGMTLAFDSTGATPEDLLPWAQALVDDLLFAFGWA